MFGRKKKLYEVDEKTLSMDALLTLQIALLAKLTIVTKEMQSRYQSFAEVAQSLKHGSAEATYFETEVKRMNGLYMVMDNILSQQVEKSTKRETPNDQI